MLDAVIVAGPGYRVEDCRAGAGAGGQAQAGVVGRVRKVVSFPTYLLLS